MLIEIYHALIHSYVRYGILTWGTASEAILKPLQTLLNKALRIMTFAPFGHIDIEPLYKELYIPDVGDTFILETSKFMFKLKKHLLPTNIANYFAQPQITTRNSYNLRPRAQRKVITRLSSSEKSIHIRGELVWGFIPETFRESTPFQAFKKQIKKVLVKS